MVQPRSAELPDSARVKNWETGIEVPVSSLEIGNRVLGYNLREKSPCVLTLTEVSPLPPSEVLAIFIQHYRWVEFFPV